MIQRLFAPSGRPDEDFEIIDRRGLTDEFAEGKRAQRFVAHRLFIVFG